jgi:hypothetical protein
VVWLREFHSLKKYADNSISAQKMGRKAGDFGRLHPERVQAEEKSLAEYLPYSGRFCAFWRVSIRNVI